MFRFSGFIKKRVHDNRHKRFIHAAIIYIITIFKQIEVTRNLELLTLSALAGGALLGQEDGLDVGQNSALGDGDAGQEFVELLVVTDGKLQMWNEALNDNFRIGKIRTHL